MVDLRGWILMLVLALPAAALGQGGSPLLSGTVVDQTDSPLPGVSVQATSIDRKTSHIAVTDAAGRFAFESLPPGQFGVTFSLMNFADVRRRDLSVSAGSPARLQVTMQVALNAAVVVTARGTFRNLADLDHPAESLVGIANAASEGAVTARQIESRPIMRAGEVLEAVPGVIISQHSGEGKANQYYLRGFNLDHGTDFATTIAGVPVNLPTHAHGQGYSDVNFLIPELVSGVQFRKGPYFAREGDFSSAGAAHISYTNALPRSIASASVGQDGWSRMLVAASPRVAGGTLLAALELNRNDGPWLLKDDYRKINGVVRFSRGDSQNAFSVTAMAYDGRWNSTDQVPARAVNDGRISRFGNVDNTDGGRTARYSLVGDYLHSSVDTLTRATAYLSRYRLNLFSNFTYALDDPENGDQFEQADRRWVAGGSVSRTRKMYWGTRRGENTFGVQVRNDRIPVVGLYHTAARVRLSTTRKDDVTQTSVGAFVENELRWLPWLRTTAGLRVDGYRVDVRSDDSANSGVRSGGLASPKGGAIIGPWKGTELYLNAGMGYHSNDARGSTITRDPATGQRAGRVTPLARSRGVEAGFRTVAIPRLQSTISVWRLDLESELLFVGDAGTTEATRPSSRHGVEWTNYLRISRTLTADADLSWSRSRFTDLDPAGDRIPGSAEVIASLGVTADSPRGVFGSVRLRYFGPRPLVEDNSVRSERTSLVNSQVGYHLTDRLHLVMDIFNVLNSRTSDIDYFYTSRLPGEPVGGIADLHTHPTLPRSMRFAIRIQF